MDKAEKIFSALQIPNSFRELVYFLGGINFITIILPTLNINVTPVVLATTANDVERALILIAISYFVGRVLVEISNLLIKTSVFLLFRDDYLSAVSVFLSRMKKISNKSSENIQKSNNEISSAHLVEIIANKKILRDNLERMMHRSLFLKLLLSYCLTLILLNWKIFVPASIVMFFSCWSQIIRERDFQVEIAKLL